MWLVKNHWGWAPAGIWTWVRYGWGFFASWGIEGRGTVRKLGPVCWWAVRA